uniref:uncharacterized protein LOC117610831 n=1 Tax=Osmia lignaria TaxID=473952 RepID=UPI001478F4B2|nr:uncharacterized protein LOC117610831 [Osmia lignaria]
MVRRAGRRERLKRLRRALKQFREMPEQKEMIIVEEKAPLPRWRLITIDIPEFDWKTYRKSEKGDPRRNQGKIIKYFGVLSASPRNSEEKCRCALCHLRRRNHSLLRTRDKRTGEAVTTR